MKQHENLNDKVDKIDHLRSGARLKNLKNRAVFLAIVNIVLCIAFIGCNNQADMNENVPANQEGMIEMVSLFLADMPGTFLQDMALDNNHSLYYVTGEVDTEEWAKMPEWSSYMPIRYYLSRKTDETGNFEVLYDRFTGGKLCFDKDNHLWVWTSTAIFKIEGNSCKKIIELPVNGGGFNSFAVDNDNNIWAGGLQTGLYKIDSKLNISHYTSELPTNSLTNIHIDKYNNIWIALWNREVLKISKDQWVVYDNISSQSIWCLITDKNDHLWIGTGYFNEENQSLRRFNGTQWETINPRNDNNEFVKGTVRRLQSDGQKIYVVAEHVYVLPSGGGAELISTELLTFDGEKWNKIYDIPEDINIPDLLVDHYRQVVWVATPNKGVYKIPINSVK